MFNALCRVAAAEDLLGSEELIGEDLSDLAPYYEMAYLGEEGEHGSWFWLEEEEMEEGEEPAQRVQRGGAVGKWVWIPANDGLRQGAPLSCMLAALAGVKCVLVAREAMDGHHQLMWETPASVLDLKVIEEVHAFAANSAEATAMLVEVNELRVVQCTLAPEPTEIGVFGL
eukprot:COSAG02_NODE_15632_length_1152_cov_1.052182_1_plen_171_part_00